MGYEIDVEKIVFGIRKEKFQDVLKAIAGIPYRLSWTEYKRIQELAAGSDITGMFEELMWPVEFDSEGNIVSMECAAPDHKQGDEAGWMERIAPYVDSGSYIQVHGEDGDLWRWVFKDGKFHEVRPMISWPPGIGGTVGVEYGDTA